MNCYDSETIDEVLGLPEDDPRLRHVAECPRCGALLMSYQDFLDKQRPSEVNEAELLEVNAKLTEFLDRRVKRDTVGDGRVSWFEKLFGTLPARTAFAAAVIAFVAVGLYWWSPWQPPSDRVVRSATDKLELHAPEIVGDARVRLRWSPYPEATGYEVRMFTDALIEIARLEPVDVTSVEVDLRELYPEVQRGSTLIWRVVALQDGDEIGISPSGSFETP